MDRWVRLMPVWHESSHNADRLHDETGEIKQTSECTSKTVDDRDNKWRSNWRESWDRNEIIILQSRFERTPSLFCRTRSERSFGSKNKERVQNAFVSLYSPLWNTIVPIIIFRLLTDYTAWCAPRNDLYINRSVAARRTVVGLRSHFASASCIVQMCV